MARCGIGLALALVLALGGTASAAGPFQPDVTIGRRGDAVTAGDDLYGTDAAGQTRSLIVERRIVVVVRVENDGTGDCSYSVTASPPAPGFELRYLARRGADVTDAVLGDGFVLDDVRPGERRSLRAVVVAQPDAPLGAEQAILVTAVSTTEPDQIDAARATVTKVST